MSTATRSDRVAASHYRTLSYLIPIAIALFLFLDNAWVSDDAYIMFRSLEQLVAGHGPVWNPHERVQVFTSPLWFCLLAITRAASPNLFLGAIAVSFVLWLATLTVLKTIFGNPSSLLWAILLFCASTGFYDYTSSGLENVLAYFIIAVYLQAYLAFHAAGGTSTVADAARKRRIRRMYLFLGLLLVTRHDLVLLLLPATIATMWRARRQLSFEQWAILCGLAAMPLLLYTLCSTVYYGFPFPNTAYAKLNTGIQQWLLWRQGIKYLVSSLVFDSITLLVIGSVLTWTVFRAPVHFRYLAAGVAVNVAYVVFVGGDFMQGRFLSYSYFVSVVMGMTQLAGVQLPKWKTATGLALCGYLVFYPHTPLNSSPTHRNREIRFGVADERGYYFDHLSLVQYLTREPGALYFPASEDAVRGRQFKGSPERVAVERAIGVFGYHAGIDKIIVDPLALSDPLLARMPVTGAWRIGHFTREIPDGYLETLRSGNNAIADPQVEEFYERLRIVTQSEPLFTKERLKTILLFNIGAYDHLIRGE
jgi:arabinofuranosyltransferase